MIDFNKGPIRVELEPDETMKPLRDLERDNAILRKALVGLVGADGREDLEALEACFRLMPVPDKDKAAIINAVDALLQTMP